MMERLLQVRYDADDRGYGTN